MLNHNDRVVQFPRRVQVTKVPGTENVYDYTPVPGEITDPGGKANYAFFESIKNDIEARLLINDKASTQEAKSATDDTKYMTPKKVKEYLDYARGVKYTGFDLLTSWNTIDLTPFIMENTQKIDIIINCIFESNYRGVELEGTSVKGNDSGTYGGATIRKIGGVNYVKRCVGKISLYPAIHTYEAILIGQSNSGASTGTGSDFSITEVGSFNTITALNVGSKNSGSQSSTTNYPTQVGIYQYLA